MALSKNLLMLALICIATVLAACGGAPASPAADTQPASEPTATTATQNAAQAEPTPTAQTSEESPAAADATTTEETAQPTETAPAAAETSPTREPEAEPTQDEENPAAEPTDPATPTAEPTRQARGSQPSAGETYTGTVNDDSGEPVAEAWVYAGDTITRTDRRGRFSLEATANADELTVMAPGYAKYTERLDGDIGTVELEPFVAKGVYVSGIGDPDVRERFLDLLDKTELNAIVINVKNDFGQVFTSEVPLARQTDADYEDFYLKDLVEDLHERDIYVIGRFTTFRDPNLAEARPDLAVTNVNTGKVWEDNQGHKWVDPFNRKVWDYFGDLGEEIAASGIDEIQFDYVRFPVDGDLESVHYQTPSTRENRPKTINAFLEYMEERLRPHKVFISADTFGLTVVGDSEQGTGQILEDLGQHLDYYSPMIYPDHFAAGTYGYAVPTEHPYEVIYESVERAQEKLEGTPVLVRPYLSAFRDTQFGRPFGLKQFLAQKEGAEDAGAHGWIYWNAGLTYPDDLFRPE